MKKVQDLASIHALLMLFFMFCFSFHLTLSSAIKRYKIIWKEKNTKLNIRANDIEMNKTY